MDLRSFVLYETGYRTLMADHFDYFVTHEKYNKNVKFPEDVNSLRQFVSVGKRAIDRHYTVWVAEKNDDDSWEAIEYRGLKAGMEAVKKNLQDMIGGSSSFDIRAMQEDKEGDGFDFGKQVEASDVPEGSQDEPKLVRAAEQAKEDEPEIVSGAEQTMEDESVLVDAREQTKEDNVEVVNAGEQTKEDDPEHVGVDAEEPASGEAHLGAVDEKSGVDNQGKPAVKPLIPLRPSSDDDDEDLETWEARQPWKNRFGGWVPKRSIARHIGTWTAAAPTLPRRSEATERATEEPTKLKPHSDAKKRAPPTAAPPDAPESSKKVKGEERHLPAQGHIDMFQCFLDTGKWKNHPRKVLLMWMKMIEQANPEDKSFSKKELQRVCKSLKEGDEVYTTALAAMREDGEVHPSGKRYCLTVEPMELEALGAEVASAK